MKESCVSEGDVTYFIYNNECVAQYSTYNNSLPEMHNRVYKCSTELQRLQHVQAYIHMHIEYLFNTHI